MKGSGAAKKSPLAEILLLKVKVRWEISKNIIKIFKGHF